MADEGTIMKFMIRSDMEGLTGVTTYQQVQGTEFGWAMLMNDLTAAVNGLLSTGEHEIVIYDEHTDGRNVRLDELPPCVSVICGKPAYTPQWGGIDSSYDAMLMIGYHARSGAESALLPHTYSRKNLNVRINGTVVGEIAIEAGVAADFGVPTWLITGDSAGMAEAEQTIPGVVTVIVKEAMGKTTARCYPTELTTKLIHDAAEQVAKSPPNVQPLKFNGPVELQIDLAKSDYLDKFRTCYPEALVNNNMVQLNGKTVTEVWSRYCEMQTKAV